MVKKLMVRNSTQIEMIRWSGGEWWREISSSTGGGFTDAILTETIVQRHIVRVTMNAMRVRVRVRAKIRVRVRVRVTIRVRIRFKVRVRVTIRVRVRVRIRFKVRVRVRVRDAVIVISNGWDGILNAGGGFGARFGGINEGAI